MLKQILLLSLILIYLAGCGSQKNMQASKDRASSEKVLIIGTGPVVSRVFLDNLSNNIIDRLHKRRIESEFIFSENIQNGASFNKRVLDSLIYDAYIIIYPVDTAELIMNQAYPIGYVRNSFTQEFYTQIYTKEDKTKPVWEQVFKAQLDITDKEKYNEVSALILNKLPLY